MLFFRPMYLHLSLFMTCRCFSACLSCTITSTSCLFWDFRILPSQIFHLHPTFSMTCGCFSSKLCILTCSFYNLQIPPSKILHQPALSMPCGYSPIKILHLQSPKIHYRRYPLKFHPHPSQTKLSSLIHQICDNVL